LDNIVDIIRQVTLNDNRPSLDNIEHFGIRRLIEKNWNKNPEERMNFKEIYEELERINSDLK